MITILDVAKQWLSQGLRPDGVAADFTMGNGHDTLFLCQALAAGKVYAFDVQPAAIENTAALLEAHGLRARAQLVLDSHAHLDRYITGPICAGVFNLGFLPGGDRAATTRVESTREAVEKALALLEPGGMLVIAVYPGHPEGRREGEMLQALLSALPVKAYDTMIFRLLGVPEAPYLLGAQRRKKG